MARFFDGFHLELNEILEEDFTGKITLHCLKGDVLKYEVHQTRKPRRGEVDLTEGSENA